MNSIFGFNSYVAYLKEKLEQVRGQSRGRWSLLAKAIEVQPSFITHVLSGKSHLSLEQADKVNQFFSHSPQESEFFLALVLKERAGTESLRTFFENKMNQLRERVIANQGAAGGAKGIPTDLDIVKYFACWHHAAVHAAVSISDLQTAEAIAKRLMLPERVVAQVLNDLCRMQMIERKDGSFRVLTRKLSVPKNSPIVASYHSHWRFKSIEKIGHTINDQDLIRSSVMTISRKDCDRIRAQLDEMVEKVRSEAQSSEEEKLVVFNLDFFEL